jgi:hypothetical protein
VAGDLPVQFLDQFIRMILNLQEEIDQTIVKIVIDFQITPLLLVEEHPGSLTKGLYDPGDILRNIDCDNLSGGVYRISSR